jgi:hypothetical protein
MTFALLKNSWQSASGVTTYLPKAKPANLAAYTFLERWRRREIRGKEKITRAVKGEGV